MADHQRVHPARDVETAAAAPHTPEAPLFPRGAAKSDGRRLPKPPRRRSCLRRCLCWTVLLLLLQIVLLAATAGILYLVFRPKLPKYSVDGLHITQFAADSGGGNGLTAAFEVNITARNPNEKIGIYYEGGSRIGVWYGGAELTSGALPKFYQGHRNTTVLALSLSGRANDGSALVASVQDDMSRLGYVPLLLRVRQPVRVKLGRLKLFKVKFLVRCRLAVDNLSPNNDIRIRSSSCKFRLRL